MNLRKFDNPVMTMLWDLARNPTTEEKARKKFEKWLEKAGYREFLAGMTALQSLGKLEEESGRGGLVYVFLEQDETREQWLARNARPALKSAEGEGEDA